MPLGVEDWALEEGRLAASLVNVTVIALKSALFTWLDATCTTFGAFRKIADHARRHAPLLSVRIRLQNCVCSTLLVTGVLQALPNIFDTCIGKLRLVSL